MGYKAVMYLAPVLRGQAVSLRVKILNFVLLKIIFERLKSYLHLKKSLEKNLSKKTIAMHI